MGDSAKPLFESLTAGPLMRDEVYQRLLEAMIEGRLEPGEWIRERDIAAQLGVSTTPVKEAMLRLHHDGLLRTEPRRGARVSEAVTTSLEEVVSIRARLEGLAAGLAARKLDETTRSRLDDAASRLGPVRSADDVTVIEANSHFHDVIRELAGNVFIQRFVETLLPFDAGVRRRALSFPEESARGLEEHRAIHQAITAGDAELASSRAEEHVLRTFAFVAERMGTDEE